MQVGSWISYIIVPPYQQNRLSVTPNVLPLSSPALLLLAPPPAFQLPQLDRHHYITRTRAVMPPASSSSLLTSISSHTAAGAPEPQCRRLSQFPSHRNRQQIDRERERSDSNGSGSCVLHRRLHGAHCSRPASSRDHLYR